MVYDFKNDSIEKLFTEQVNFGNIQTEYFDDDILVLLNASTEDKYKDRVVNQLNYKTLYIYSLTDNDLREI